MSRTTDFSVIYINQISTDSYRRCDMATQSFYQDIVLRTKEEVDRLVRAFDEADRRGPIDTSNAVQPISDSEESVRLFLRVKP